METFCPWLIYIFAIIRGVTNVGAQEAYASDEFWFPLKGPWGRESKNKIKISVPVHADDNDSDKRLKFLAYFLSHQDANVPLIVNYNKVFF